MIATSADLLLAVDVGTLSARAGLFDATGALLATGSAGFTLRRPREHQAAYAMDEIWAATIAAIRACLAQRPDAGRHVRGLAFDATSSLVLNHTGAPPLEGEADVFCWMDHRGEAEAAEITRSGDRMLRYLGGSLSPELHLGKLLWLKRRDPAAWSRLTGVRDLCDELARRATGVERHSVCGLACKWAYLPHADEGWRTPLLERFDLADLPGLGSLNGAPLPVGAVHGTLGPAVAEELGLDAATVVGIGLIDAEAGALGSIGRGFTDRMNETAAVIGGTSTCVMAFAPDERNIPGVWGPFKDAVFPGLWMHEAGQSLSGAALDAVLLQHPAGPRQAGNDMHAATVAEILPLLDAEGPRFAARRHVVPDWLGNRSPYGESRARAIMTGIGTEDSRRAFLETYYATARALVLQLRHILEHMDAHGYTMRRVALSGGHLRNPLMHRLYRDATGATLVTTRAEEPVLLGTAMVAASAAGLYPDLAAAVEAMSAEPDEHRPDPAWRAVHDTAYRAYTLLCATRARIDELHREEAFA